MGEAKQVLERGLEANHGERRLHYAYVRLLLEARLTTSLAYHLERSFTPGDANFDAQILLGRQSFINGDRETSKSVFRYLRRAHVGPERRQMLLHPLDQVFRAHVARIEASYCFIARNGINDWIFAHRSNIAEDLWRNLSIGARSMFRIGFTLADRPHSIFVRRRSVWHLNNRCSCSTSSPDELKPPAMTALAHWMDPGPISVAVGMAAQGGDLQLTEYAGRELARDVLRHRHGALDRQWLSV